MTLAELGEERLLRKLLPHLPADANVVAGPGDDCAVVRLANRNSLLVLKTDCVVEGVHFTAATKPRDLGWKAMARALSDFAAASAVPQFALVTLIARSETTLRWTTELYRGLENVSRMFEVAIVGGETSATAGPITVSVCIAGSVERRRWVSRRDGKPGDDLYVTGQLGGSIRGKHLRFVPRIKESRWLTSHFKVHAMMDLSDGLGADLPRLAEASAVGFELDREAIPRNRGCSIEQAISDGEDFELLFALAPSQARSLASKWRRRFPKLRLTRIGRLTRARREAEQLRGYVHFQKR